MSHLRDSTVAGPTARRDNVLASKCEYPPFRYPPFKCALKVRCEIFLRFLSQRCREILVKCSACYVFQGLDVRNRKVHDSLKLHAKNGMKKRKISRKFRSVALSKIDPRNRNYKSLALGKSQLRSRKLFP